MVEAFTEGATLAVVFLAVEVLSAPAAANWLNGLPATGVFASLLALAVVLLIGAALSEWGEPGLASP